MVTELIQKYIWLYDRILNAGDAGITFREIASAYGSRWRESLQRRTFINYREAVQDLFGVVILCNRADNRYRVKFASDASDNDRTKSWLINTFTVNNMLSLRDHQLSGRVSVEDVPSGHRWLTVVLEAMGMGRKLRITHRSYTKSVPDERIVSPYGLKEDDRRWYMLAKRIEPGQPSGEVFRVYGLDRVLSMEILPEAFTVPEDFDIDYEFRNSYGPFYTYGEQPQKVVLRVSQWQARYLRDLPLHHSQEELPDCKTADGDGNGVLFSFRVVVNAQFVNDICRMGKEAEVISPQSLRDEVRNTLASALAQYGDNFQK